MSIEVKQESHYKGNDWWQWAVWLEGPENELDPIDYVVYTLHPTFPKPERRIADRKSNFRFKSSGWGEFTIYIKIHFKSGDVRKLQHWLKLDYPSTRKGHAKMRGGRPATEEQEPRALFLSSSFADMHIARELTRALEDQGIKVLTQEDVNPDLPWEVGLNSVLDDASNAAFIVSERPSPWVDREIEAARNHKIPMTAVVVGGVSELAGELQKLKSIRIAGPEEAPSAARALAEEIKSKGGI